jgi:NTP pyrophosphatase (non-canonical NTP hydrolase)
MQINEYQKAALRTANSNKSEDLILNGILGLCGETGEVADHIKKATFQGHELNKDHLVNELGDVCWYIAIMATGLNVDLETIMKKNIEKLQRRYPDGFESERSLHRPQGEE